MLKIIDAHLHFFNREGFRKTAQEISQVTYSAEGLKSEFDASGVIAAIVMTTAGRDPHPASGQSRDMVLKDGSLGCLYSCVGVNPVQLQKDGAELEDIERELCSEKVTGIKIYAGYFPYYAFDPVYDPIYRLAVKYDVPVAIHCGDTSSPQGLLKYAHPLTIDELAVSHPDINFVICHMGDPWVMDTAELITKNPNVYTDVSGLIAGNRDHIHRLKNTRLFVEHFQRALVYADRYDKILFGTDWPLVPIAPYIEFIKAMIPEEHYAKVFCENARLVYPKLRDLQ